MPLKGQVALWPFGKGFMLTLLLYLGKLTASSVPIFQETSPAKLVVLNFDRTIMVPFGRLFLALLPPFFLKLNLPIASPLAIRELIEPNQRINNVK